MSFIVHFTDINPVDLLILSIYYIEKIVKYGSFLNEQNKLSVLWISCLLSCKYLLSYETSISYEHFANLGGYSLAEYVKHELFFLKTLEWKVGISMDNYERLFNIATVVS